MKILLFSAFIGISILFANCSGRCSGYGDPYVRQLQYEYKSIVFLRDSTDTIRSLTYDILPGTYRPNKRESPIAIPHQKPAIIHVSTDKNNYSFRIIANLKFTYYHDRECSEYDIGAKIEDPVIDSIQGGQITRVKSSHPRYPNDIYNYQYIETDSILLTQ
ncbi:MAG: hypothetical protein Q8R57_12980 [Bacteroidota bacterium]|jgi:hypothetical protein|nr:hypothetical protein [Bacteroidota bacterium]